ncbi:fimbrial protein [Cronobacter turicensis]
MNVYYVLNNGLSVIKRLSVIMVMFLISSQQASAYIESPFQLKETPINSGSVIYHCDNGVMHDSSNDGIKEDIIVPTYNACQIISGYVPHTGNYRVRMRVKNDAGVNIVATSSAFYMDSTISIAAQNAKPGGQGASGQTAGHTTRWWCTYLVDDAGAEYVVGSCHDGGTPLPPTPPVPDTSCTINNGNTLSVSLGTLERSEIPTAPGSGSARSIPFAVNCTGGNVTVNMQMNYTPISVGSSQAVKTSANGVGVSVLYDNKPLSTTDITPVTFLQGSNTLNLSFEAVRDAAVKLEDIPTGAFTANAVLVMTQQ